jgi:hypothetical protein
VLQSGIRQAPDTEVSRKTLHPTPLGDPAALKLLHTKNNKVLKSLCLGAQTTFSHHNVARGSATEPPHSALIEVYDTSIYNEMHSYNDDPR